MEAMSVLLVGDKAVGGEPHMEGHGIHVCCVRELVKIVVVYVMGKEK